MTSIGKSAFQGDTQLPSIFIPNSVTTIKNGAFSGCLSLRTVHLPDALAELAGNVFQGCTQLESVVIPSTMSSMGNYAFNNCTKLTIFDLSNTNWTNLNCNVKRIVKCSNHGMGKNAIHQIPDSYSTVATEDDDVSHIPASLIPDNFIYKVSGSKTDQWKAKKVVLKDDTCRFKAPVDFTADSAVYTRTFADSNRSTLCLPFTVAKPEGFEVYKFTGFSGDTLKFQPLPADSSIRANRPYLVGKNLTKATNTTTFTFTQSGAKFPATPATMPKDSSNYMTFQGTMARTCMNNTRYEYKDGYFVQSGNGASCDGGHAHVNPFRAYFTYSGTKIGSTSLGIDITDGDNLGIEDVVAEPETESRIYYSTDVYDLMGRIVRKNAENLNGLPKGIYIWKGKKVINI